MLYISGIYLSNTVSISCYILCKITSTEMTGRPVCWVESFLVSLGIKSIILTPSWLCFYGASITQSMNKFSVIWVEPLWNI